MDRALQERTIGAVVLVAVAVLIVPVFLDGSSDDAEMVTETVVLPGQNDQPRRQQTIVLKRDREQPVPAATVAATDPAVDDAGSTETAAEPVTPTPEPVAAAPTTAPERDAAAPRSEPEVQTAPPRTTARAPAEPRTKPEESPASGLWAVQLGSFSNRDNAERLAAELRDGGYAAFLSRLQSGSNELHRVRVGPQKDRDAAEQVAGTLASAGHSGQVVPHP